MTIRSTSKTVTFAHAFRLGGVDGEHPAGNYTVETDEEQIDAASMVAYRRMATWIRLPLPSRVVGSSQTVMIDPAELDAALARDAMSEPYGPETSAEHAARAAAITP